MEILYKMVVVIRKEGVCIIYLVHPEFLLLKRYIIQFGFQ